MAVVEWIEAKRDGRELPGDAIREVVSGYARGEIPDYQMSAFLMAVAIRGMSVTETIALTRAMVESGHILDLSSVGGIKVDKHSTGGVGDKVTLALVPILAACGLPIAKMSGHALGHTGGTLDKLESIPGLRTDLTENEIVDQVYRIGACICAQTDSLAPADRSIYALRDVTGSVASIPLIASSILSKKIACGAEVIVLDIKVGAGAFMKDLASARELAKMLVGVAEQFGKRLSCFLTDMDQPLGHAVGNRLEIVEIVRLLKGEESSPRLKDLTLTLCREALRLAGVDADPGAAILTGAAWSKFREIVRAQGGDTFYIERATETPGGRGVAASWSGYVRNIDALAVARIAGELGAARERKGDKIDPTAGVWLKKSVGEKVDAGETIAILCSAKTDKLTPSVDDALRRAFKVSNSPPLPSQLVLDFVATAGA